ncbi:MAG: HGGxSTG domain-containing protein [Solirubrobacteraceae bacterium]
MELPPGRECGAKTRDGDPCKNWGMQPSGRCRMHGGKSRCWFASPRYEHGWYSKYDPKPVLLRVAVAEEAARARGRARAEAEIAAERARAAARGAREEERRRKDAALWATTDVAALMAAMVEPEERLDFAWMFEPAAGAEG